MGFQEELPSEECNISYFNSLFDDEVSHVNEIKDENSLEECKTLILSSKLNDELNSYCKFVCVSNHAMSFVLILKEEIHIKDQWAKQHGEKVDAYEEQDNQREKFF